MPKKIDLTGKKFGRLTAIREVKKREESTGAVKWLFKCDCGKEKIINGTSVRSGKTKSCGCLQQDHAKQMYKQKTKESYKKTREKLLEVDEKENTRLSKLSSKQKINKNNTSGTRGVSWYKSRKKWRSLITLKGKTIHLGYFEDKQDAINARKEAEKEYFEPILEKYGK